MSASKMRVASTRQRLASATNHMLRFFLHREQSGLSWDQCGLSRANTKDVVIEQLHSEERTGQKLEKSGGTSVTLGEVISHMSRHHHVLEREPLLRDADLTIGQAEHL